MADDASDFRIRARLDTSDLPAGADEVVGQMDRISGSLEGARTATEKATESSHSLQGEQAGSIRTTHHLIESLELMRKGGADAFAGVALDARIAAEIFEEGFGPAAPFIIAISTLAAFGLPALGRALADSRDKAGGAKEKADDLATSLGTVNLAASSFKYENYGDFLKTLERSTELIKEQAEGLREIQRAQDELRSNKLALQIASLDDQEARESTGKNADEKAAIHRKYDRERLEARAQFEQQDAAAKVDEAAKIQQQAKADVEANQNELYANEQGQKDLFDARTAAQGGIPGIKSDVQSVQDRIDALEKKWMTVDPTGQITGLSPREKIEYAGLQDLLPELQKRQDLSKTPQYDMQLEELKARQSDAKEDFQEAWDKKDVDRAKRAEDVIASTTRQIEAIESFTKTNDDLNKAWQDSLEAEKKLTEQRTALAAKLEAAGIDLDSAKVKAASSGVKQGTEAYTLDQSQKQQVSQEDEQNTIDSLKRDVVDLQAQLKNPALNEAARASIQQQITDKEAQQKARELAFQDKYGLISPAASALGHAEVRDEVKGAQYGAAGSQYGASSQALADLVAQGMARANASNNAELKEMLATAPDDRSRAQLLAGEYGDSSDASARGMAQQITAALNSQDAAKNLNLKGGDVGAYDQLAARQADIISRIGAVASADGMQKLIDVTSGHVDTQVKINAVILQAQASHNTLLTTLAAQLQQANAQLAALVQAHQTAQDHSAYQGNQN